MTKIADQIGHHLPKGKHIQSIIETLVNCSSLEEIAINNMVQKQKWGDLWRRSFGKATVLDHSGINLSFSNSS